MKSAVVLHSRSSRSCSSDREITRQNAVVMSPTTTRLRTPNCRVSATPRCHPNDQSMPAFIADLRVRVNVRHGARGSSRPPPIPVTPSVLPLTADETVVLHLTLWLWEDVVGASPGVCAGGHGGQQAQHRHGKREDLRRHWLTSFRVVVTERVL